MTLLRLADAVDHVDDVRRRAPAASSAAGRPQPAEGPPDGGGPPRPPALGEMFSRRRTIHEFTAEPAAGEQLQPLLTAAFATHGLVRPAPAGKPEYAVIAVRRSAERDFRGIYATAGATEPLADESWLPLLSDYYTDAAVLFLVCGSVRGARADYARHLVGAGALGHALWLAALSAGLGGRVFGRSCHPATVAARRQRADMRHLLTLAVGHAEEAPL
ncbi:nitroreductase family protein [Streptomyces sp. MAR4 CNX-425]|uniref:nitroreductase family protein n=1 Tax=Streptomyces sp. MAR4 CNX-425 TaxID=3406343 RepID=UPI003B506177